MIHDLIPHLTQDGEGYVYWKGAHVEHYSFRHDDRENEVAAAHELAKRCLFLESLGVPVNANTAIWRWSWYASLTPDILANRPPLVRSLLLNPRDFYEDANGRFCWIAESAPRDTEDEWKRTARVCVYDHGEQSSFHLDSDECGGYYHPIHAIGWKSAQMGQAEMQGCCYANTEQVLAWFAGKMEAS